MGLLYSFFFLLNSSSPSNFYAQNSQFYTNLKIQWYVLKVKYITYVKLIALLEFWYLKALNFCFSKKGKNSTSRVYYKAPSLKQAFRVSYLAGVKDIALKARNWGVPVLVGGFTLLFLAYLRSISVNKVVFAWVVLLLNSYWVISTFNFFFKKYYYAKFTTGNQRFWKRSLLIFWVIELFLFSIFFFLTLTANSESFNMLDQLQLYKYRLTSVRSFLVFLFPYLVLVSLTYLVLLNTKWQLFSKNSGLLAAITFLLIYIVFNEFYQFFHVINFYSNLGWVYDIDDRTWVLELESRKTRTLNHYISLLIILKFWHIVFIFMFWLFFILRINEIKRIRYQLLASNLQNFLFLYFFCWVLMFPWLKFFYRHYFDYSYYWFFINFRKIGYLIFFNDLKLYFQEAAALLYDIPRLLYFDKCTFFYWAQANFKF